MKTLKYIVRDMHCAMCKKAIEKALSNLSGVTGVNIDLNKQTVAVAIEDGTDEEKVVRIIRYLGYTPERKE